MPTTARQSGPSAAPPQVIRDWLKAPNAEAEQLCDYLSERELRQDRKEVQLRRRIANAPEVHAVVQSLLNVIGWRSDEQPEQGEQRDEWPLIRINLFLQEAVYFATSYTDLREEFYRLKTLSESANFLLRSLRQDREW